MEVFHYLNHPDRAAFLAKFPKEGLYLEPDLIIQAIQKGLRSRGATNEFRSAAPPFILLTAGRAEAYATVPARELYRAMSFHPALVGRSVDLAEGLWVYGTAPDYGVFVQATDPYKPKMLISRSYVDTGNVIPSTEDDNFRVAAIRSLSRLGLMPH